MGKKIKIFTIVLIIFIIGLSFFKTSQSLAQICGGAIAANDCYEYCSDPCNDNNLTGNHLEPQGMMCVCPIIPHLTIEALVAAVISFILKVATIIYPLMIIIAAFYFMTATGNPSNIEKARNILIYSSVGYGIVILANALVYVIKSVIGA